MSFIIFVTHGEAISPAQGLTVAGLLTTIRKANAVLACLPEGQRIPRPKIISGPEKECLHTAEVLSAQYLSDFAIHPALGENPKNKELEDLAQELVASTGNTLIASHGETIGKLLDKLADQRGEKLEMPLRNLAMDEVAAMNMSNGHFAGRLRIVKASKVDITI